MNTAGTWSFTLFNFPVRVHISFFFIAILLGLNVGNIFLLLIWVAIVFVSILLHELGHAVVANYYGRAPHIELYSMGGLTVSSRYSMLSYPKEILISFAGSLAGFILGGILFALLQVFGPIQNPYLSFIIGQLLWVNIGWGIINLIPIIPLDGGSIMRNIYHWVRSPYDESTPLKISIGFGILAIIAALVFLGRGGLYLALLAGWLTYNNFVALKRGYWTDSLV